MRSSPRIHVVGSSPRSGTTLMFELVVSCFDIVRFGDHEVSLFERPQPLPAGPWASKKPTDFIHVCRVMRWDPGLHVIYMQRDPRDVIVSQHGSRRGRYWCDFDVWRRNQMLLPRLAGHPRFSLCRYEDLTADPDRVQAALQAQFGFLRPIHAFSRFEDVAQSSGPAQLALKGVRRISADGIGKWRENLPRVAAQLAVFPDLPDHVMRAGYEGDRAWLSLLEGVVPDAAESVRAEHDEMRGLGRGARGLHRIRRRLQTLRAETAYVARAVLRTILRR